MTKTHPRSRETLRRLALVAAAIAGAWGATIFVATGRASLGTVISLMIMLTVWLVAAKSPRPPSQSGAA